jgi:hypothetical protein
MLCTVMGENLLNFFKWTEGSTGVRLGCNSPTRTLPSSEDSRLTQRSSFRLPWTSPSLSTLGSLLFCTLLALLSQGFRPRTRIAALLHLTRHGGLSAAIGRYRRQQGRGRAPRRGACLLRQHHLGDHRPEAGQRRQHLAARARAPPRAPGRADRLRRRWLRSVFLFFSRKKDYVALRLLLAFFLVFLKRY